MASSIYTNFLQTGINTTYTAVARPHFYIRIAILFVLFIQSLLFTFNYQKIKKYIEIKLFSQIFCFLIFWRLFLVKLLRGTLRDFHATAVEHKHCITVKRQKQIMSKLYT